MYDVIFRISLEIPEKWFERTYFHHIAKLTTKALTSSLEVIYNYSNMRNVHSCFTSLQSAKIGSIQIPN